MRETNEVMGYEMNNLKHENDRLTDENRPKNYLQCILATNKMDLVPMRIYMDHCELYLVTFDMRMCLHIVFHQSRGGLYKIHIHDLS